LLSETYNLSDGILTEIVEHSREFNRGNDPRLQHFVGVDPAFVRDRVLPEVLA